MTLLALSVWRMRLLIYLHAVATTVKMKTREGGCPLTASESSCPLTASESSCPLTNIVKNAVSGHTICSSSGKVEEWWSSLKCLKAHNNYSLIASWPKKQKTLGLYIVCKLYTYKNAANYICKFWKVCRYQVAKWHFVHNPIL